MPALITRSQWGAVPPRGSRNAIAARPLGVGIHWNGPGCASALRSHGQCGGFIRGIQRFHMGPSRGWSDIAYSLFICPHGYVYEGRGKGIGSAAFGTNHGNANYYALYAMWGQGDGPAPAALLDGITDAVALCRTWGAGKEVIGHRDENKGTECPGDELYRLAHSGRFEPRGGPIKAAAGKVAKAVKVTVAKATGSKVPAFPGTVRRGSKGAAVRAYQSRLRARGWKVDVDGVFGPGTEAVVRAFQREKRLTPDGIAGRATWTALWTAAVTR